MALPAAFGRTPRQDDGPLDLSRLIVEPDETYRAKAGEHLGSHDLAEFRHCPQLYRRRQLGLIPRKDSHSYLVGRAAHKLVLEGREAFDAAFQVGGAPINPQTGNPYKPKSKAYDTWLASQSKGILEEDDMAEIEAAAASVRSHDVARELLAEGAAERVARAEYCGVACQARADWLHPRRGLIDFKTTSNLDFFESSARAYGYLHQLAFYREVLAIVLGRRVEAYLIATEKAEPFRTGVWHVLPDVLAAARKENEEAIHRLRHCRETDTWPTGYEQLRTFDWI